jgi:D-alanyl-D-alanine carboxypeptidase
MYKPPLPQDDEQHDIPEFSYPARQRRVSQSGTVHRRRVPGEYRTDERPGEPKIKRASLLREQQVKQAQLDETAQKETGKAKAVRKPAPYSSRVRDETGNSRAVREPYANPRIPREKTDSNRILREPDAPRTRKPRDETDIILMTPSRRPTGAYAPRKTASRPSQRGRTSTHSTHSWRSQPRPLFTRKQAFTVVSLMIVMVVLFIPIALISKHNSSVTFLSTTPGAGSTQPGSSGQSTPARNLVIKPQDIDHPAPPVLATSAYLLDADSGDTVYAYQPFMRLPMLSTTKLMTAALAIEQSANLDQKITITNAMSNDISQLSADSALFGIKKGEIYTLRDLLYGLLFVSGNDAAIAIADTLGGNLQHFVDEMNQKAQQLGLYDTHFMNPHGLLEAGQYSSAHDLALLGMYSLGLPVLHQISGQNAYHIPKGGNHPERFLVNENQFMWWYPGVDGGKTGYDNQSDFIQVMSVTRNHHHLIGVVMHTSNWWTDMRDLMNWGFDSFTWISPRDVDTQHAIPYDYLWNFFAKDTKDYTVPTADNGRYYVYTGYSLSGPIMAYFDAHKGLQTFGYPTKMMTKPAASFTSQQFEHGTIQCDLNTNTCQQI